MKKTTIIPISAIVLICLNLFAACSDDSWSSEDSVGANKSMGDDDGEYAADGGGIGMTTMPPMTMMITPTTTILRRMTCRRK